MTPEMMWIIGGVWTVAVSVLGGGAYLISKFSMLTKVLTTMEVSLQGLNNQLSKLEEDVNKEFDRLREDVKDDFSNVDKDIDEAKKLRDEVSRLQGEVAKLEAKSVSDKELQKAMGLLQTQINEIDRRLTVIETEHGHNHKFLNSINHD